MDSNFYTQLLDQAYEKVIKKRPLKLTNNFEKECKKFPYLQQCKIYDC